MAIRDKAHSVSGLAIWSRLATTICVNGAVDLLWTSPTDITDGNGFDFKV